MKRMCLSVLVMVFVLCSTACGPAGEKAGGSPDSSAGSVRKASDIQSTALDMGKEDNTRITVAVSIPENRFIDTAAANFQKNNPGIIVDVKYYTMMGETITREIGDSVLSIGENLDPMGEKYVKTISTELMSGEGPDIIDTFYLPCDKFADNGFLCDIRTIIRQDAGFNESDYYENILSARNYKGGLFTMPIGFSTQSVIGIHSLPADTVTNKLTLDSFFKSAREAIENSGAEGSYVLYETDIGLFREMFEMNYDRFIDQENKKCDFTSGEFVKLIKQIKEAADDKYIFRSKSDKSTDFKDMYFLDAFNNEAIYLEYFKYPHGENNSYAIPSLEGNSNIEARIHMEYGINKQSKSVGAAWKFLKYIISEEMQKSPELYYFPINKNSMTTKIQREKASGLDINLTADDPVFSRIDAFPKKNWQVFNIVTEETTKYFEGQRSAEDTANIIQSRVNVMINE